MNWDGRYLYHPFLHSTTVSHYVLHVRTVYSGMQEWVIQIPSIPIHVSVLFSIPTSRIKFLLLVNL